MALGDNTLVAARGNSQRGRNPYMVQSIVDMAQAVTDKGAALAATDVIPALTIPANTVILACGMEVTEAHAGTSTDTAFDLGIGGGANFVDDFDFDGASVGDYAAMTTTQPVLIAGAADNIDITIGTMTGTTTGGKLRVFAVVMDIDDLGPVAANEVDRDTLA